MAYQNFAFQDRNRPNIKSHYWRSILLISSLSFFVACNSGESEDASTEPPPPSPKYMDVNKYALNKLVCDPFDDRDHNLGISSGLRAELYYQTPDQERFVYTHRYIDEGVKSDKFLFFSSLNVPTRLFDLGFPTETGGMVQTDEGDDLFEYFALRFDGIMRLPLTYEEGDYELALLSDDGAVLRVMREEGGYKTVVDNDFHHPTKMGCSEETLSFTHRTSYRIQLDYFQGPKNHIALVPLWRKVEGSHEQDPQCGKYGNSMYFDYNNDSEPQQAYYDLLDRGWSPIPAESYELPAQAMFNPCIDGVAPVISDFKVEDYYDGQIKVSWKTDIEATAQVRYVDVETGEEVLTESDNLLRTDHNVFILAGFKSGHTYLVQGVSISDSYGKSISDPETITIY